MAADTRIFGTVEVSVNPLPIEGIDVVLQLGSEYLDGAVAHDGASRRSTTYASTRRPV